MAVGGLVLSLSPNPQARESLLDWLRREPRIETGPREGDRMAVVATTATLGEGHELCQALLSHPGIENLEVAYVASEEDVALASEQGED